jgi:hypothetical protein
MKAATVARSMGVLRAGLGVAHVVAPVPISTPLIGSDADLPGTQVFIACFGTRDALLGLAVASARTEEDLRRWLRWAAAVDLIDTLVVIKRFRRLPARRRWAAVTAPGVPAIFGAVLVAAISRASPRPHRPAR